MPRLEIDTIVYPTEPNPNINCRSYRSDDNSITGYRAHKLDKTDSITEADAVSFAAANAQRQLNPGLDMYKISAKVSETEITASTEDPEFNRKFIRQVESNLNNLGYIPEDEFKSIVDVLGLHELTPINVLKECKKAGRVTARKKEDEILYPKRKSFLQRLIRS